MAQATITRVPVPDLCALWAETRTAPMNIALIGTFDSASLIEDDGQVRLEAIRAAIASHLDRAPMLRRVLRQTRLGQGRPVWIDAQRFRIQDHVVLVRPERAFVDEDEFLAWSARRSTIPLDRARPLWRMDVVPGLPGGRIGVVIAVHHVVADGLRGVEMIGGLLDQAADEVVGPEPHYQPEPQPTAAELVVDNVRNRIAALRRFRPGVIGRGLRAVGDVGRERARHAPATVLGGPIGAGRRMAVVRRSVEELRAAAHTCGCTINDLLLAAVSHGLRDMLVAHGQCPDGLVLRASAPVGAGAGRHGGMMVVPLPIGTADPAERLRFIATETARRKQRPDEGVAGIVSMPASLARLGVLWARRSAASHINLYVTNVPGPASPLFLAGGRLRDVVPLAPLVAGVRLSVTALSYDGTLSVALLADESISDLPILARGVRSGFDTSSQTTSRRM